MPKEIVSYTGLPDLSMILIGMVVGIAAACLIMLYQIRVPGKIIRALIRAGADAPEKALNAGQLGFKHEWLLAFALGENGAARKDVGILPGKVRRRGKKTCPVLLDARFYILPETKLRASMRYDRKNASWLTVVGSVILFAAAALVLAYVIPDLIQMLKNALSIK